MNFKKKLIYMVSSAAILGAVMTFALFGDEADDVLGKVSFSKDFPEGKSLPDSWQDKVISYASVLALDSSDKSLRDLYEIAYTTVITRQLSKVFNYHYVNGIDMYRKLPVESRPTLFAHAIEIMQKSDEEISPDTNPLSMAFSELEKPSI